MEDNPLEENSGESLQAPKENLSSFAEWRCQESSPLTKAPDEILVCKVSSRKESHSRESREENGRG
jgi:hypothetical protein